MPRQKLTARFVNSVKPSDQRVEYRDTELDGFELRVSPSGDRAYRYVYREGTGRGAKRRTVTLGKASELSADEARKLAQAKALRVSQGGNPAEERDKAREELTVYELWERFEADHLKAKGRSKRTIEEYRRLMRRYIQPAFGRKLLSQVTRTEVEKWHRKAYEHPRAANHAAALLSSMHRFGNRVGCWDSDNPCTGLEKYPEKSRAAAYSVDEIAKLLHALRDEPEPLQMTLKLLIDTGARVNEALNAEWSEFHLAPTAGRWTLPAEKMKQRKAHTYLLSDAMVEDLIRYRDETPLRHMRWAFPGPSGKAPRNEIRHALCRIEERAGVEHVPGRATHGFRHAALSMAAESGLSASDIQQIAGHADIQTSMKYVHRGTENPRLRALTEARAQELRKS